MSAERIRIERRATETEADPNAVGYGRPPKDHQFKAGHSGNPRGRPKGSRNFTTDVKAMLKEPVRVSRGGKAKKVSTQRATLMRLSEKALSGDVRALDRLLILAQSYNNEDLAQSAVTLTEDDATLFEVLTARVRSGAIGVNPAPDVSVPDAGSGDAEDGEAEEGGAK